MCVPQDSAGPKYVADASEIARILASRSDYSCFRAEDLSFDKVGLCFDLFMIQ